MIAARFASHAKRALSPRLRTTLAALLFAATVSVAAPPSPTLFPDCKPVFMDFDFNGRILSRKYRLPEIAPPPIDLASRYDDLTDADFKIVARQLNVEVAAIKAVVEIEAGREMKGFWAPGVPVINFDASMYARFAPKAKCKAGNKTERVPSGLTGYALREWTSLVNARRKNVQGANMGTFWGMFQIGGFNYKMCGCESIEEFVKLMCTSEFQQLELFATFLQNADMVTDLRNKNWAAFARKYNGASYARRGYHTRMAAAYAKYRKNP